MQMITNLVSPLAIASSSSSSAAAASTSSDDSAASSSSSRNYPKEDKTDERNEREKCAHRVTTVTFLLCQNIFYLRVFGGLLLPLKRRIRRRLACGISAPAPREKVRRFQRARPQPRPYSLHSVCTFAEDVWSSS